MKEELLTLKEYYKKFITAVIVPLNNSLREKEDKKIFKIDKLLELYKFFYLYV